MRRHTWARNSRPVLPLPPGIPTNRCTLRFRHFRQDLLWHGMAPVQVAQRRPKPRRIVHIESQRVSTVESR